MIASPSITSILGHRLREARLTAGFTVREAATKIGLHTHTGIVKYEQGDVVPPLERLEQLANLYHISLACLFLTNTALIPIVERLEAADAAEVQMLAAALGRSQ